jgi:hypothetical protein
MFALQLSSQGEHFVHPAPQQLPIDADLAVKRAAGRPVWITGRAACCRSWPVYALCCSTSAMAVSQ